MSNSSNSAESEALLSAAYQASLRYVRGINKRQVAPTARAISALSSLHEALPEHGTDPLEVFSRLDRIGSPATMATTGGRFFGFVVGGALPVTIAAAQLAAAWDQNAGTSVLAPIAAELETVAAAWALDLLGLPEDATVGFVTGSTMGTFSAIAAARSALLRRQGYDVKQKGLTHAPRLRVVTSVECHPTNLRTLNYAGIGLEQVEFVETDAQGRFDVTRMPELDALTIVMLQAGNINSGACDPFRAVCAQAKEAGAWVHVDGAFGLWAQASQQTRHLTDGVELADSWSIDGHKWLNLPQDSAIYVCRNAEAVADVFGVEATYLVKSGARDPNTFTPELSRRARGVEWWAALATLGRSGVEAIIDRSCKHAKRFAEGLSDGGYVVLNDVVLNQVVFALQGESDTKAALERIQAGGETWLGPTTWKGRYAMRISVSSAATTMADVEQSIKAIIRAAE